MQQKLAKNREQRLAAIAHSELGADAPPMTGARHAPGEISLRTFCSSACFIRAPTAGVPYSVRVHWWQAAVRSSPRDVMGTLGPLAHVSE